MVAGEASCPLILLCEHASNQLPPAYGNLGPPSFSRLPAEIRWDLISGKSGVDEWVERVVIVAGAIMYGV